MYTIFVKQYFVDLFGQSYCQLQSAMSKCFLMVCEWVLHKESTPCCINLKSNELKFIRILCLQLFRPFDGLIFLEVSKKFAYVCLCVWLMLCVQYILLYFLNIYEYGVPSPSFFLQSILGLEFHRIHFILFINLFILIGG